MNDSRLAGLLGFTGLIALPAIFLTPGVALAHMPVVGWPITMQGLRIAAFLILRAKRRIFFASADPVRPGYRPPEIAALFPGPGRVVCDRRHDIRYLFLCATQPKKCSKLAGRGWSVFWQAIRPAPSFNGDGGRPSDKACS